MTAADIVNRALELAARNVQVTGVNPTFDGTPAGNAAGVLYTPVIQLLLRQLSPAFARRTRVALAAAGGAIPPPWTHKYTYPADCVQLRQVQPATTTANDPQPVRAQVAFDQALAAKIIVCSVPNALVAYTSSLVTEDLFDAAFAEAAAHRLASPLTMALAGRPDFARELLEESMQFAQMAELVDES